MKNQSKRILFPAGIAALFAAFFLAQYVAGHQNDIEPRAPLSVMVEGAPESRDGLASTTALTPTSCRYGVGYVHDLEGSISWIQTLNAGWFVSFSVWGPGVSQVPTAAFAPIIRVRQDRGPGGVRLPTYTFTPPLVHEYLDENNNTHFGLGWVVANNPGQFWIVGNEVDVDNYVQDSVMPEVYARAYHDAYHYIKRLDPTAKVAIAGLSMMTPGRQQYLSIVWNTYHDLYGVDMPVDIWNMHLYILEERNSANGHGDGKIALGTNPALAKLSAEGVQNKCPSPGTPNSDPRPDVNCRAEHDSLRIYEEQITEMRQWMKERGQQNKPLIISEYGLLYKYLDGNGQPPTGGQCTSVKDEFGNCFDPTRVTTYLNGTMNYLATAVNTELGYPADGNRLVQQWLWYSVVTHPNWSGGSSNLVTDKYKNYAPGDPAALTMMGQKFKQLASAQLGEANLAGGDALDAFRSIDPVTHTAWVDLTATFRNDGTKSIVAPFKITFYSDSALTNVIGSAMYDPNNKGAVTGCTWDGRNDQRVTIRWNNLPAGKYYYWAKIDSENAIAEPKENDNVTRMGTVIIYPYGTNIPVVNR